MAVPGAGGLEGGQHKRTLGTGSFSLIIIWRCSLTCFLWSTRQIISRKIKLLFSPWCINIVSHSLHMKISTCNAICCNEQKSNSLEAFLILKGGGIITPHSSNIHNVPTLRITTAIWYLICKLIVISPPWKILLRAHLNYSNRTIRYITTKIRSYLSLCRTQNKNPETNIKPFIFLSIVCRKLYFHLETKEHFKTRGKNHFMNNAFGRMMKLWWK